MIVFPAIDLRGGRCVRLYQGRPEAETVYSEDPVEIARMWARQGASWLHVVDLDGALEGRHKNLSLIREIILAAGIPVQVGGGVRSLDDIEALLKAGAARVILGTVAVTDPKLVVEACARYGEAIVVGLDCRDGRVATKGWTETLNRRGVEVARELAGLGVKRLVYTDISRDGTLKGPNLEAIREVALASGLPIIASGGVASLEDIIALRELRAYGIEGVIIGQALYQGRFSLTEAIKAAGEQKE